MTTQAKNSLKYPPHQWFDIQKSSLAKESQTQRRNFRRAHPDLAAPAPRFSPDELEDPAKTIVLPSEIFAATWTASISRVGTMQGTSCWRQNPQKGPAPHLIPPRPVVHCSSTGEIYELGGPVHPQDNLALPQVCMAPDFKAKVSWPKLPDCGQRVAGIPMQALARMKSADAATEVCCPCTCRSDSAWSDATSRFAIDASWFFLIFFALPMIETSGLKCNAWPCAMANKDEIGITAWISCLLCTGVLARQLQELVKLFGSESQPKCRFRCNDEDGCVWLVDTGSEQDLISEGMLKTAKATNRRISNTPISLATASGSTRADEVADVKVDALHQPFSPYILEAIIRPDIGVIELNVDGRVPVIDSSCRVLNSKQFKKDCDLLRLFAMVSARAAEAEDDGVDEGAAVGDSGSAGGALADESGGSKDFGKKPGSVGIFSRLPRQSCIKLLAFARALLAAVGSPRMRQLSVLGGSRKSKASKSRDFGDYDNRYRRLAFLKNQSFNQNN
ncbi:unnamed protein product [Cladocopium goreaui]|uniref:Uncharacterized protein n=1 Tax=Cladocopium goreaui TaxID=2562237 RepID=A0A9P1GQJ6_9DINO|nr:unnamed protein product [Cladocopium goreaui]